MQVNSVSNLSANQKASFGNKKDFQRAILEEFAKADDRTLRRTAIEITEQQVDSKKHKRISNLIWGAIPVAAGLAAAVAVPGGRVPMLKQFAKTTALWIGAFAGRQTKSRTYPKLGIRAECYTSDYRKYSTSWCV